MPTHVLTKHTGKTEKITFKLDFPGDTCVGQLSQFLQCFPHTLLVKIVKSICLSYHIMHPCQLCMDNNSASSLYTDSQTNDVYEWKRLIFLFSVSKVGRRKGAGAFVPFFNPILFEIWILFGEFLPHKMELSWLSIFIRNATKFR